MKLADNTQYLHQLWLLMLVVLVVLLVCLAGSSMHYLQQCIDLEQDITAGLLQQQNVLALLWLHLFSSFCHVKCHLLEQQRQVNSKCHREQLCCRAVGKDSHLSTCLLQCSELKDQTLLQQQTPSWRA